MAAKQVALNDEEFFYAHLADYLDDEGMPPDRRQRFEEIAKKLKLEGVATDYGIRRGRLQIEAQRLFLDDKHLHDIHDLVEDDAARAKHEAEDIEEVGKSELKGNVFRFTILLAVAAAFIFGGVRFFSGEKKAPFKALDSLIYEAIVMTEDPQDRLDFPTEKLSELNDYFKRYPDLGFKPKVMQEPGTGWDVNGGTVIDYEVAKVLAVQFTGKNTGEKLYLFLYEGSLEQLPASTPGNFQGLVYQAYASDKLNIVAWQASSEMVGMMIGYRGAKELSELAFRIIGL
jgi:hypothetical protein